MNQKQVKLLRYFAKASGDLVLAGQIKEGWNNLTADKRGKLTTWLKTVTVTLMAVAKEKKRAALESNKKVLDGFLKT